MGDARINEQCSATPLYCFFYCPQKDFALVELADLARVDCGFWATVRKIRLQSGYFTFKDHEFQAEPMSGRFRRVCYLKAAQCFGATEMEVLKDLWGMIMGWYPRGVLHAFPSNDEVSEFGKSRFKPLILANRTSIGQYVKDTDTATLKRVRDAFLYLRGARLSQKVGDTDEDTSSKTAGFSIDRVVFDEVDYMDPMVIEKLKGRMGASEVKEEVYLGNPSQEDYGIDKIFKQSDQRHWFRKCGCGHWTCAEESFETCIRVRDNGTGYVSCTKCGKELPAWSGEGSAEWVPKFPDKTEYMRGYRASQLMNPWNDPAEILADFENPPHGNLADVYRLRLGMAYSNKEDKLRKEDVLACCGSDILPRSHKGPCAMGVDVGKIKHVVIGIKTGKDRYEILRAVKVETFREIADLARKFKVKSDVIDIRPYEDEAREYQKASSHKTFLCEYSDTMMPESVFNDNTGVVRVHRTGIFDATHRLISEGKLRLPRQCPEMEEFARQCCNCAKFEEKDKKKGTVIYRYRKTGDEQEHFRNALNYFYLAASGHRIAPVMDRYKKDKQVDVISDYVRC